MEKKSRETSEKVIEKYLVREIEKIGGVAIKLNSDTLNGLPDRLVVYDGHIVFVELKSTGVKPRKLQLYTHGKLREQKAPVRVIDSIDMVNELIDDITYANL